MSVTNRAVSVLADVLPSAMWPILDGVCVLVAETRAARVSGPER